MASGTEESGARRLLVLGAGRHQTPLIQRAEARGIEVVVADYLPDSPGKAFATHNTMVDMLDVEAVCEVAARFAVDGVVTTGTDQAVVTMAEVAERFSLPQIVSPRTAKIATDKRLMKGALAPAGVNTGRYVIVDKDTDPSVLTTLHMPVVVKPTDSQGQRGTRRVDDRDELADAIAVAISASRGGEAVVEEFVEGMEVTASAWVVDGVVHLLLLTDRVTYNPPPAIGIAVQHVHPSRHAASVVGRVRDTLERIRAAFGVERGPMYVQMIITPDGEVHLVEAACRVGGGHEIALVPIVTGVDMRDRLIDLALTGTCAPIEYEHSTGTDLEPYALVNFLVARPGTIASQRGMEELTRADAIAQGDFYHRPGYEQGVVVDGQSRVGYFIATADNPDALLAGARDAFDQLSIRSAAGEELLYWPEPEWTRGA